MSDEQSPPTLNPLAQRWQKMSNMRQRIITSMIFLPIVFGGLAVGGFVWTTLTEIAVFFGLMEFYALAQQKPYRVSPWAGVLGGMVMVELVFLGLYGWAFLTVFATCLIVLILETIQNQHPFKLALQKMGFTLAGLAYVALPAALIVDLRVHHLAGIFWIFIILSVTVGTDTFAYFGGRLWGKRKLAPILSPNKTIEGALIGAMAGFGLACLFLAIFKQLMLATVVMVFFAPFIAIAGDLFESALKRYFKVKDSHLARFNIMPGHGGVLDRIDSLLLTTPFVYLVLLFAGLLSM